MTSCRNCQRGAPFDGPYDVARQCRLCFLYHNDAAYRALWDGTPAPPSPPCRDLPCVHLGADTGKMQFCLTCKGKVQIKLFVCGVYGQCSLARPLAGVMCCATCPDYRAAE